MSQRDPKPEIYRLEELAIFVKNGEIKLPKFQRPFVWKPLDMLKLLDSIYKGYPIGSLLLWNSSQRLKSERNIAGLDISDETIHYPTNYLLDGQQRLTTLCGALFWDGVDTTSVWNIHFDLDSESFLHAKNGASSSTFPLNKLIDTGEFIRQCMKFASLDANKIYTERAEKLLRTIKDYKVAVVKIGDMSIEEVAPIFERINSTGRKLTIVDLMMAATWSNGFDLSYQIDSIISSCENEGFNGLTETFVLRSIAASAGLGINKDDIQKLRYCDTHELNSAAISTRTAIDLAVSWVKHYLSIKDFSYIPYALFFTYLVEVFRINQNPTLEMNEEIKSWFWYTSCTQYFAGASTGDITRELLSVRDFAKQNKKNLFLRDRIDISRLMFDKFILKNASSTSMALLLLSKNPEKTVFGTPIDYELIVEKSGKTYGRIAPQDIVDLNISVVINLSRKGTENDISNNNLEGSLLNSECVKAASENNVANYIALRSEMISKYVSKLTDCYVEFKNEITENQQTYDVDEE